jgi:hypothetical protein
MHAPRRSDESFPLQERGILRPKQQDFDGSRTGTFRPVKTGRQNPSIVQDEKIGGTDDLRKLSEKTVPNPSRIPAHDKQT